MIYVLQIQTGKETEVCASLKHIGIKAYAPCERIIIRRGGLWTKMLKLLFPGYVFTDIEYSAERCNQNVWLNFILCRRK